MAQAFLEHVNLTVQDPRSTADMLCKLFDWRVRWQGAAIYDGFTVHVGGDDTYLALYTPGEASKSNDDPHYRFNGLNHVAIVVEDLDAVEDRVKEFGLEPINHADYHPGRRFYFYTKDGVEFEIVSYASD